MRETSGQPIPPQSFFLNTVTSTLSSPIRLCLNQGTADLRAALARRETGDLLGGGLGDFLVGLSEDELNVAGLGLVGVDTTVSCHFVSKNGREILEIKGLRTAIGTSALSGSLVYLNSAHDKRLGVQSFNISVGLGVLQQIKNVLGTLDRPASLGDTELLA